MEINEQSNTDQVNSEESNSAKTIQEELQEKITSLSADDIKITEGSIRQPLMDQTLGKLDNQIDEFKKNYIETINIYPTHDELLSALKNASFKEREEVLSKILKSSIQSYQETAPLSRVDELKSESLLINSQFTLDSSKINIFKSTINGESRLTLIIPGSSDEESTVVSLNYQNNVELLSFLDSSHGSYTFGNLADFKKGLEVKKIAQEEKEAKKSEVNLVQKYIEENKSNENIESKKRFKGKMANIGRFLSGKKRLPYYSVEFLDELLFNGLINSTEYKKLFKQSTGLDLKTYQESIDPTNENQVKRNLILKNLETNVEELKQLLDKKRKEIEENIQEKLKEIEQDFEKYINNPKNVCHTQTRNQLDSFKLLEFIDNYEQNETDKSIDPISLLESRVIKALEEKNNNATLKKDQAVKFIKNVYPDVFEPQENLSDYIKIFKLFEKDYQGEYKNSYGNIFKEFSKISEQIYQRCSSSDTPTPCQVRTNLLLKKIFNEGFDLTELLKMDERLSNGLEYNSTTKILSFKPGIKEPQKESLRRMFRKAFKFVDDIEIY